MRLSLRLERVTMEAQFELSMAKAKDGGPVIRSASYASRW